VFQTYPQAERLASRDLTDRGFQVEVPMQLVADRKPRVPRASTLRPMFSGYGFVHLDGGDGWVDVRNADGVRRVFTTPQMVPLPVPVGFVEGLIASAPERLKLPDVKLPAFPINVLLRVTQGPLEGQTARSVRSDQMTTDVEIELMGRQVRATFPNSALAMFEAGVGEGLV
jgi:transcription antitermination factor NusG